MRPSPMAALRPHAAPARPDTPAYALNWEL